MPKYRKKPVIIEAIQLGKDHIPDNVRTRDSGDPIQPFEVFNPLHNSWIKLRVGDMIRTDLAPKDVYPIERETFETTYDPAE